MNLLFELCVVENSLVKNVFFFRIAGLCIEYIIFSTDTDGISGKATSTCSGTVVQYEKRKEWNCT